MRREHAGLSWTVTALASVYVLGSSFQLARRAAVFAELFASLGAELPAATRLVLALGRPAILGTVAVLMVAGLIVKEWTVAGAMARIGISVIVFMAAALFVAAANEALFQPMLHLMGSIQ